jgi:hypothetical protein
MEKNEALQRYPRLISTGFVIAGIASVFGFATMMYLAVTAVTGGRGIETYRTVWLDNESWIGFLAFVAIAFAAMIVAALFRLRDELQWRRSEHVSDDTNLADAHTRVKK